MTVTPDDWRERAEAGSAYVLRHLAGWLSGAFIILVGLFIGLAGTGALNGHLTVTAHPGTLRVQSCELAVDHYTCTGTFADDVNGKTATGVSIERIGRLEPGERLPAFKLPTRYSEYATHELVPSELARGLYLIGFGTVSVTVGLFGVLTGYAPRPNYMWRRDPPYGYIHLRQAWQGLGRWRPVRPLLIGLACLGVLIAAGGGLVAALY
ncbi:hypothetical protein GTY65_36605 [Streptomyces sp. SID8379]|uniref:hypothetical protein n=1 Tax=unclassified Streptomyces TaxID=2593676 RepID=UPI00035C89D9|nr:MULTISPECIES: hypothetical protein [unclassified Streptomyces]MYW69549.1 hypothetical protein [Streptomyces sp. SID8379]